MQDGAPSIVRANPFVSDFDRLASRSSVRSARMKPVAVREGTVHLSADVRGMLKDHADQFLAGGYNGEGLITPRKKKRGQDAKGAAE